MKFNLGNWKSFLYMLSIVIGLGAIAIAAMDMMMIPDIIPEPNTEAQLGFIVLLTGLILTSPVVVARRYSTVWLELLALEPRSLAKFLSIAFQLGLLVLVIRQYELENKAFTRYIMPLTFGGFVIHHFLPLRYRLPFFLLLSVMAIIMVLGIANGTWLIALGLVLIGICHLPTSFLVRVLVLVGAGALLVVLRARPDWLTLPWSIAIWPILGSMFMFRLIFYMYRLRHQKEPTNVWRTLSYFFLLPNVVFPLFPVVDFNSFRRNYYDKDRYQIYQKGIDWIFRGAVHLILYRFVSYYLIIAPEEVVNVSDLVRYVIANFALYLRVSGQFHIIVGILHLFGFNLPETHHLYYLSSSFTDFWRRINIYWKDFMLHVFYYPAHFRLRKWGTTSSLVFATILVFILTWFLHAYQWFWLRGTFLLVKNDVLFWVILAIFVIVNSLYEMKYGRKRSLGKRSLSWRDITALAFRTMAVFTIIAILWSFWSSDSLGEWLILWSTVGANLGDTASLIEAFLMIAAVFLAIFVATYLYKSDGGQITQKGTTPSTFFRSAVVSILMIGAVFLVGNQGVYSRFGDQTYAFIDDLTQERLNAQDARLLERGYYEDLTGVSRFNSELWELYSQIPADWVNLIEAKAAVLTNDFFYMELLPSHKLNNFKGAPFSTNRWGMRDKDYEKSPSDDTYRIALLGASRTMGSGVADDQTFEWLLEDRLNRENQGQRYSTYEILNFAVGGYSALQNLMVLENKALAFEPDAVFYMGHIGESDRALRYLAERIRAGVDIPYSYLEEIAQKADINQDTPATIAERQLRPFEAEMLSWTYRQIVETAQKRNIPAIWIYLPNINANEAEDNSELVGMAEEAGFTVMDLSGVFQNEDSSTLSIAEWDLHHPNARGHQLIADRLYEELLREEGFILPGVTEAETP